jgi:hypothetical protein
MKIYFKFILILITIAFSAINMANDILRVELKNRSAASLKSVLSELVEDDVKIISDGNSLILRGEASTLTQLKKIINDLDVVNISLSVSIYRGVDPNIQKENKGIQKWGTNKVSNRIDSVIVENGQRLLINESKLLVVPIESFSSRFNEIFDSNNSLNVDDDLSYLADTELLRDLSSTMNRNEVVTIENSLFVEPSLIINKKEKNKAITNKQSGASADNQEIEKVFIRYSVPIIIDDSYKTTLSNNVLSSQTHVTSQRIIYTDEWMQLSGRQIISYRPSLSDNKKVVSTKNKDDSDNNIWIKVNRLD